MGDKAIIADVLEASNLASTYSSLTAKSIIDQLKKNSHEQTGSTVRYEGLEDDPVKISGAGDGAHVESAANADSFTVDDAVEFLGFGKFQLKLSFLTGLAWMADAMEMMILSILSPALYCEWEITTVQQAMITTCVFSGMMLSSTVWGKVCDRFGRRTGLMLSALLTFSMGALSSLAPNFNTLLLLRGLTGIGIGGVPQSVTLYAEFLPMAQRAKCVVLIESFWAVGAAFEALLALFIMETWGWRWLLIFSSLPLLFFAISCFWLPESARFLMASGDTEGAYKTLQRVARDNGMTMPRGKLVEHPNHNPEHRGHISNLFVPDLFKTTLLLWFIWAVNAFCYYGIVLFTTVLFQTTDECHGGGSTNVTTTGCHPLVQKDYIDLLSTTMSEFPGLILTACIIEWFGRKKTMAIEFSVYAAFMLLLYFCLDRAWVTAFIFVARAFISGAFQCVYVYTPEVYPTTLRAIGLGASSSMARLGAIITPFIAQVASGHSLYVPITVYAVAALMGLVAALSLPIETKGRQMKKHHLQLPKKPEFSTLSGDFFTYADKDDHYWSGYYTSRPFYKHMDRSLGHYLRSADLAFSSALMKARNFTEKWAGIADYDQLVEARRTLSLFQHHDGVTGTSVEYVVKDYAKKLFVALFQCRNIIASATEYLLNLPNSALNVAEEHKINVLPQKVTAGPDAMVVVQNSLGYRREEVVCIQVNTTKTRIRKIGSDDAVLQQIEPIGKDGISLSRDKFQLCFVASTPPFGFSRYELHETTDSAPLATLKSTVKLDSSVFKTEAVKTENVKLSNGLITAKFNAHTGFLSSIQTTDATMNVDMSFVYYGARPHKYYFDFGGDHRSGAYLFLPDGDASPLPTKKNAFVVVSGPVRQSIVVKGSDEIKLLHHVSLDINTAHFNIRNVVDIRSQGNFEAAMRLKTDIIENDRFYTELNGYQLIRRKRFAKLPLQAHFFPMPGAAFIEDSAHRLTLLGRQALGVASLQPGWMEVILDRRLDQHDWRGMSEPVHDNLQTESNFRLVLESVDGPPLDVEPTTGYHSLATSILSTQIHYPPVILLGNRLDNVSAAKVPSEVAGLTKPLPCDIHAVALRTLSQPTKYASDGHRKTKPDNWAALVLHRFGVECRIQTKLPASCPQMSFNNTIDIRSHFNIPLRSVQPASLTLLYTDNHTDLAHLEILPMELKTVKIKF